LHLLGSNLEFQGIACDLLSHRARLAWRTNFCGLQRSKRQRGMPVKLLRPVTASLLLSTLLLASTARWAATDQLRKERTQATQQKQVNEFYQREQLENLKRALELNQTQRQLDQLRQQEASRPGLASQSRAQQLNETQKQLDQLNLEQQLNRVQQGLKLNEIEREQNPLRRQEQLRELQLQQQIQSLQDQSRTKLMQQDLNRLR
jgi:hypothetical protein